MSGAKQALGWPLRRMLNERFRSVNSHVDWRTEKLRVSLEENAQEHLDRIQAMVTNALQWTMQERLATDEGLATVLEALRLIEDKIAQLQPDVQDLLDWANGPEGFAAQAGLWFNPPVTVTHTAAGAQVGLVNERIVEVPFTFAALAPMSTPSRLLDVGGAESTLALSLASMGHQVTVVDPRGYRLTHPNLRSIGCRFDELSGDVCDFDAAIALSAVEHFGLGHYVPAVEGGEHLDKEATARLRERVRTGGLLVLTVPLGEPSVDDFQRVYDLAGVRELLGDWTTVDFQAAWSTDSTAWTLGSPVEPLGSRGVALVIARNERS